MDTRPTITIDLSEYGSNGLIVMGPLTFRRDAEMKNNIGKCTHYSTDANDLKFTYSDVGDVSIYRVLAYVIRAPFDFHSKSAFLNFMDGIDSTDIGMGQKLFDRMKDAVKDIQEGKVSPFVQSEDSTNATSESN